MECWQFIQSPAGSWYWLCSDVLSRKTRTSIATFETRTECISDAMSYGYQKVAGAGRAANQHAGLSRPRNGKASKHKR